MRYSIDGAPDQGVPAGTPVTVSGTGTHHLVSWVVDVAGNASGPRDDLVKIDNAAAHGHHSGDHGLASQPLDLHRLRHRRRLRRRAGRLEADDDTDAEAHTGPSGSLAQVDGPGPHTLYTKVYDNAGNTSGWTPHRSPST